MTTTKKDLALRISEKLGVKKQLAYEVVDTLFKAMRESLIQGNRIEIRGFGVLGVKDTKPKPAARNPRTGEIVYVPARKKSYFKAGVLIKKALHQPLEPQDAQTVASSEPPDASGGSPPPSPSGSSSFSSGSPPSA
ncbi:MAG: DNA-binding protein [Gemmatimonadetes bacterium]|nr:DNA-binding protein [Gemmatimonadota bacterium]|tara:strand:- start:383 stop:790 length:408 start_codon:yes stop_codon:yes gene_type:complete